MTLDKMTFRAIKIFGSTGQFFINIPKAPIIPRLRMTIPVVAQRHHTSNIPFADLRKIGISGFRRHALL
jgi:hypothetical protein